MYEIRNTKYITPNYELRNTWVRITNYEVWNTKYDLRTPNYESRNKWQGLRRLRNEFLIVELGRRAADCGHQLRSIDLVLKEMTNGGRLAALLLKKKAGLFLGGGRGGENDGGGEFAGDSMRGSAASERCR